MLQERVDRIKQAIIDDLKKGEQTIFNGLVTQIQPNRLPESIFVSYFLPGFLGTNPNQNWLLEWISIAGSPSAEVAVFDPATQQELFRVPPVLASRNILLPRGGWDLNDIFTRHEMMKGSLGGQGTKFLFNALAHKSDQALSTYQNTTNDRWAYILARYGYAPVNEQPTRSPQASGDDLFEY